MKRIFIEDVRPLTYEQLTERRQRTEYEKTKFYVNRYPRDVYIRDRSGLLTKIKQRIDSKAFAADYFYICEQLQCTPEVSDSYIEQARQTSNSMRQYSHKVVLSNWAGEPPVSARYSVEALQQLSLQTLLENDGVVYLEEHDIVVLYGLSMDEMASIYHPYSLSGYAKNSFKQINDGNDHLRKGDFTFNIRIVDNSGVFGNRWILIGEESFCIVAGKDNGVTDGIYVTYSKNLLNGSGPKKMLTDRFDFNNSINLPYYKLYESHQEAMLARRSIQEDEAKARIQELESKTTSAENSWRKAQQERDNIERDAMHRKVKHEQEMEKLKNDNEKMQREHELYLRKQIGETLSTGRKNTMEIIKYVPVVLSAVACIASIFKKK